MERSVHDNRVLSYCVIADKREIHLHTVFEGANPEYTDVIFDNVIAYDFATDNFDTVLFDVHEISVEELYAQCRSQFENDRKFGWPGAWNRSDETFLSYILENDIKAYSVWPACGMNGWVLAKSMKKLRSNEQHHES